jgi:hypothetical protein
MIRNAASPRTQQAVSFALALMTTVALLGGVDRIARDEPAAVLAEQAHATQVARMASAVDASQAQVVTITARRG